MRFLKPSNIIGCYFFKQDKRFIDIIQRESEKKEQQQIERAAVCVDTTPLSTQALHRFGAVSMNKGDFITLHSVRF